jgi:hypothetical protein
MDIELKPRKIVLVLVVVVLLLVLANILALISEFAFGHDYVFGLIPLIALDEEENLPTYFSSGLWLACAVLSLAIAAAEKTNRRNHIYWRVLALICLYISVDEFVAFHERVINARVRGPVATAKPFYVSWILVYAVAVIGVALTFGRFVLKLPSEIRRLFIISGVAYVVAAIGFEEISGLYLESHGWNFGLGYHVITLIEETLEMGAIVTFLYALMLYAGKYAGGVGVRIGSRS